MVSDHALDLANADDYIVEGKIGGPVYREAIEEMDRYLTKVIEDFDRAINVEALRLIKETGKHALTQPGQGSSSTASCRATIFARVSRTCQSRLQPESPLYGGHPTIYPYSNHGLGG